MIRAALRLAAVGALAVALSGCISLLPKSKPAQLYRFGQSAASAPVGTARTAETVRVFLANGTFQGEGGGDRLLTISGGKAAYVAQSRWVEPAGVLWNEAVSAAFDADAGRVRLVSRGQQAKSSYALRLDVRNFEARYDAGPNNPPTVVVRLRAVMTTADLSSTVEKIFEARTKASDNRVGAIVSAYDKAVAEVLGELVGWTNANIGA
jgi:cholesterol transport system auxiliary component